MKQSVNRWVSILLAVVIVLGISVFAWQKLKASETDGSISASESQEIVEKQTQQVTVPIPEKKAEEKKEEAPAKVEEKVEEPIKVEAPVEEKKEEAPVKEDIPAVTEEPVKAEEPVIEEVKEEPVIEEIKEEPVIEETPAEDNEVKEVVIENEKPEEQPVEEVPAEFEGEIKIEMLYDGELEYGTEITLKATVIGNDEAIESYQWQCNDGSGWKDIPGADELTYVFTFEEENEGFEYRLMVK